MVKIKTSPETKSKVTLTDLNSNIIQLTQALNKNATALNAAGINNLKAAALVSETNGSTSTVNSFSSSTKSKEASWYTKAGQAAWKNSELNKQSSNIGSSFIGGLTGISPAIVQRLGIDKAVGSILKSTLSGIKKRWAEAGKNSNSTKVNSAIESNKISPITKRLDKIVGLLKDKKSAQVIESEKKNKGIFDKILSFLGGMLKVVKPLINLAGITALLAGIAATVNKIADWFDWKPGENPTTDVSNINTLKDVGKLGRAGYQITKGKVLGKVSDIAKARSAKKTVEAGALITKLEKDTQRIQKARTLSNEAREAGNIKRAEKLDDIANAKEAKAAKDARRIRELQARAARDAKFAERVNQLRQASTGPFRAGVKMVGGFGIGTGIDAAASELAAWYLDKEGNHVAAESLRRQYKAVIPYNAVGTGVGAVAGGVSGAAAGGAGAVPGAVIGSNIGYAATDLTISELVRAKVNADTYKEYGVPLPKPDHSEISPFRAAGDWHYYTYDQLQREGEAKSAKEELKRIWKRNQTEYYNDKEYESHPLIDMLPDGAIKDWAYRLDHGIGTALSALPETFGVGTAYLKNWLNGNEQKNTIDLNKIDPTKSVSYPSLTTPVYGLTTDFDSPIAAADEAALPTEEIAANTKTTNDYLQDILNAITDMKGTTPTNDYLQPKKPNIDWLGENKENANAPSFPGLTWMYSHGQRV